MWSCMEKEKKKRIVPIHEKLCIILRAYMKDKGIDENMVGNTPLFTNANGRQLTTAGLAHIINNICSLSTKPASGTTSRKNLTSYVPPFESYPFITSWSEHNLRS